MGHMRRVPLLLGSFATASLLPCGTLAAELTLFKSPDFGGASQSIKGEVSHLEDGFARDASSVRVRGGYWLACTHSHFKGDCYALPAGDYPRLRAELDRRIVSVRFLGTQSMLEGLAKRDTGEPLNARRPGDPKPPG